jgi:hypothetical protein
MVASRRCCVYCGEIASTKDHVPPKLLFARPRPANLITVPSCRRCNSGFEKDDEYFRIVIGLRADVGDHPAAQNIFPALVRSLNRPAQRGFARSVVAAVTSKPVSTDAGLYLGHAPAVTVDLERLRRTARRIVQGLYFSEFQERIAGELRVWSDEDLANAAQPIRADVWANILHPLYASTKRTIGDGVFSFWGLRDPKISAASAWILEFFGQVRFLALTVPGIGAPHL